MIFEASEFTFEPSPQVSRARQILIKPFAGYPLPYPITTCRGILKMVICRIREVSRADIILLEGSPRGEPMKPLYESLSYDFPRVLTQDVKDCVLVEVENPLPHPLALSTFWLPNLVLYCDYLVTISPLKVLGGRGSLTIKNLLGLLPVSKYGGGSKFGWGALYNLGMHKVIADLYFTLPFDLGIIDARKKFIGKDDPTQGEVEDYNKIFLGEPYEVDKEASQTVGVEVDYLPLIEAAKAQLESKNV